mmetsp:Transcript_33249/g.58350  ORF Transcript_33249/g.58350 Transcript_33249/m.58350 type:complete len:93 (-) Transcript_33249:97-375(-)
MQPRDSFEIEDRRAVLRQQISELRNASLSIREDLDDDKIHTTKLGDAYVRSSNYLAASSRAMDHLLNQKEVQIGVYVVGTMVIIFLVLWKLV